MSENSIHIPILRDEILQQLDIKENDVVVDGTLGFAGHSSAFAEALNGSGSLIGIDQDLDALSHSKERLSGYDNVTFVHANFSEMATCLSDLSIDAFDKCLLDLGVSSFQLDQAERGFSHRFESLLDMRMNQKAAFSAVDVLNDYDADQLSDMFYTYGELKHNKKLVENILEYRKKEKIERTDQLISLIKKSYYFYNKRSLFIKHCSLVFQAIRIEVNDELGHLERFLHSLDSMTKPGSRVAILTFHSLEDRMVKRFVKESEIFQALEKNVIKASKDERRKNSRARSAKLRVFERKVPKSPKGDFNDRVSSPL